MVAPDRGLLSGFYPEGYDPNNMTGLTPDITRLRGFDAQAEVMNILTRKGGKEWAAADERALSTSRNVLRTLPRAGYIDYDPKGRENLNAYIQQTGSYLMPIDEPGDVTKMIRNREELLMEPLEVKGQDALTLLKEAKACDFETRGREKSGDPDTLKLMEYRMDCLIEAFQADKKIFLLFIELVNYLMRSGYGDIFPEKMLELFEVGLQMDYTDRHFIFCTVLRAYAQFCREKGTRERFGAAFEGKNPKMFTDGFFDGLDLLWDDDIEAIGYEELIESKNPYIVYAVGNRMLEATQDKKFKAKQREEFLLRYQFAMMRFSAINRDKTGLTQYARTTGYTRRVLASGNEAVASEIVNFFVAMMTHDAVPSSPAEVSEIVDVFLLAAIKAGRFDEACGILKAHSTKFIFNGGADANELFVGVTTAPTDILDGEGKLKKIKWPSAKAKFAHCMGAYQNAKRLGSDDKELDACTIAAFEAMAPLVKNLDGLEMLLNFANEIAVTMELDGLNVALDTERFKPIFRAMEKPFQKALLSGGLRSEDEFEVAFSAYLKIALQVIDLGGIENFLYRESENLIRLYDLNWARVPSLQALNKFSNAGDHFRILTYKISYEKMMSGALLLIDSRRDFAAAILMNYVDAYLIRFERDYAKAAEVLKAHRDLVEEFECLRSVEANLPKLAADFSYAPTPAQQQVMRGGAPDQQHYNQLCAGKSPQELVDILANKFLTVEDISEFIWELKGILQYVFVESEMPVEEKMDFYNLIIVWGQQGPQGRLPIDIYSGLNDHISKVRYDHGGLPAVAELLAAGLEGFERRSNTAVVTAGRGMMYHVMKVFLAADDEIAARLGKILEGNFMDLRAYEGSEVEEDFWQEDMLGNYADPKKQARIVKLFQGNPTAVAALDRQAANFGGRFDYEVMRFDIALETGANASKLASLYRSVNAIKERDEEYEWVLKRANVGFLATIIKRQRPMEALGYLQTIEGWDDDEHYAMLACTLYLITECLSRDGYEAALSLAKKFPEIMEQQAEDFEAARVALEIPVAKEIGLGDYLDDRLADAHVNWLLRTNDGVRTLFTFAELAGMKDFVREMFDGRLPEFLDGQTYNVSDGVLSELLGAESVEFAVAEEYFEVTLRLGVSGERVESKSVVLRFDGRFDLLNELQFEGENETESRLFVRLLECAVAELVANRLGMELGEMTMGILHDEEEKLKNFVAQMEAKKAAAETEMDFEGIGGLIKLNTIIAERLESLIARFSNSAMMPGRLELEALIQYYKKIIAEERDLERPRGSYISGVDEYSPMKPWMHYLEIFGGEMMQEVLQEKGVKKRDFMRYDPTGKKNNFVGYYQLQCAFEDMGKVAMSVFIDEDGDAYIPGISRKHPLYNYLNFLVLETLAKKVVPDLGPYSQVFLKKEKTAPRGPKRKKLRYTFNEREGIRRICCAMLVPEHQRSGDRTPMAKIAALEEIAGAWDSLALTKEDISAYPLCVKDGVKSVDLKGLIINHGGVNHFRVDVLKTLMEEEDAEILDKACDVNGVAAIKIGDVPEEVGRKILAKVKVRTPIPGRALRLGIGFKEKPQTFVHDGVEYLTAPAKNRSGNVVEVGGRLLRLRELPERQEFVAGGRTYWATPRTISSQMREVIDTTTTIDFKPQSKPAVYVLLFDVDGEIVGNTFVGWADKNENGEYLNLNVKRFEAVSNSGDLASSLSPKLRPLIADGVGVDEAFVELIANVGYRQGVFLDLWKFFYGEGDERWDAHSVFLEAMRAKSGSDVESLRIALGKDEEKPKAAAAKKQKTRKPGKRDIRRAAREAAVARSEGQAAYTSERSDLADKELYRLPKDHPFYEMAQRVFDVKQGELIVLIGSPTGKPVKVKIRDLKAK